MITFSIQKRRPLINGTSINDTISLFLIIHAMFFIVMNSWYKAHILWVELGFVGSVLLSMLSKKQRYIYQISLNNDANTCIIRYYQFLFLQFEKTISYEDLSFLYERTLYRKGTSPLTLRIKEHGKMIAEIREKYNLGWSNEEIAVIQEALKKVKDGSIDHKM
ncbi:hypothetical protein [Chitinophaga nivalis]|uniref:DUF4129 domain-containing protein n=1 Tax=Chitinophaga nivalis TaxID=2991709 RepID=A0ABT3IHK7_9BACT|nr:hypothetical protein [Chitinophaga nivalis]MCW3466898.1 hypothetical protein [Chitinophaga nivalis]MCW3483411.1 hypothetical protein [Chitinophaga nivalis]